MPDAGFDFGFDFDLAGKRIWVAGHAGLVGSSLCRRLEGEKCTVLTIPRSSLDLTSQQKTNAYLQHSRPDAVILAAARVGGIGANIAHPAQFMYENLAIAQNVIHGAYEAGVKKLLFLGSSCLYPADAAQPLKESALMSGPMEPTNEGYAMAKIAGIKLCEMYRREYGCDFISALPTNLYGPNDSFDEEKSHVIPALINKFVKAKQDGEKTVTVWGTGKPMREFLYVDDLADALILLLKRYNGQAPVNIGSGEEVTISALAAMIARETGFEGDIVFDPARPDGVSRKRLDCAVLTSLGWVAQTPLAAGLEKTVEWYRNHCVYDQNYPLETVAVNK